MKKVLSAKYEGVYTNPCMFAQGTDDVKVLVHTPKESIELIGKSPALFEHGVDVEVHAVRFGDRNIDDDLDKLSDDLKKLIGESDALDGIVHELALISIDTTYDDSADHIFGGVKLLYRAKYRSSNAANERAGHLYEGAYLA
ncbi:MAG: hypothetical protein HYW48_09320 [Deltaproteobacteria bacterium]|nr:hypothetical protein [Deltaproteobacteria bacterium]